MAKRAKNKESEQNARNQADMDVVTEAYEDLFGRVKEAKKIAENPQHAIWFMARKNKVDDAVAKFKEAAKIKSDAIEEIKDIDQHTEAMTALKKAVKDMDDFTIDMRIVCGDLSEFLKKHPLYTGDFKRSAVFNQKTGLIDVVENVQ